MAEGEGIDGILVDIDTGVLRRDRMLVQNGPGATAFLGIGPRAARLRMLAFSDSGGEADPFIARCRRVDRAIEGGYLAKAADCGVPPAVAEIADRAMRRLVIAESLTKAGYDPDEPRVPAGNPQGGEWTTGGDGGGDGGDAVAPSDLGAGDPGVHPIAAQGQTAQHKKERFVDAHLADTQPVADQLGVPVENILGVAALESSWGTSPFAVEGNNFFGLHYPALYASGYMEALGNKNVRVSAFEDYAGSLASFAATSGSIIQGKADPEDFAAALQNSGKFGIDPATGAKMPKYVHDLVVTIYGLQGIVSRRRP